MKKRVLMILIIVMVILLIPRYTGNGHRAKTSQGQRLQNKKTPDDPDEFDLPFPGIWSLGNFVPGSRFCGLRAVNIPFIASIYKHNAYKPVYQFVGMYGLT